MEKRWRLRGDNKLRDVGLPVNSGVHLGKGFLASLCVDHFGFCEAYKLLSQYNKCTK